MPWPDWGLFDAVLVFNYLDRPRFPRALEAVRQGGLLIVESFLTTQREQGWGPTADAHLLLPGELARLVAPLRDHAWARSGRAGRHRALAPRRECAARGIPVDEV